ncbi:hypothetical protein GGS23DRAFT_600206 [Durotheca rogersii]|uniref:uncharacterized protein n=1 Tax=Durotheca rogersii TaxID=419775 RepID=UPI00222014EF|nr:uncharacterized protein GGS23DRAFT_600206 [Durotheca rogersii]KAI5859686.1 hypothetical protein GGS23DRAFT_600206 [Durotheca rogersii]
MWLLENEGEALDGKRLWLRPGKRYLFGRTVAEPGQLAIKGQGSEKVSRKHLTIRVNKVAEGDGELTSRRSRVTVEDLGSKGGTWVNDEKIKGDQRVLSRDINTIQMGSFLSKFYITWFPVVLSFSFTASELLADPFSKLRQDLEQLDVKFLLDYDVQSTTHAVSRKRNTPNGLQALVNGRYIVTKEFLGAIISAAAVPEGDGDGVAPCPLESDFDAHWPDAVQFLPPPGDEPVPRPVEAFAPNPGRMEIFHGYTFIFYNKRQYDNLLGPITSGRGKALLCEVTEGETQVDDFIRYVKTIAGEKGLGEFEDGSEGKGVVVVRWIPNPPETADWFTNFYTSVSLRLDHRLIDQKEFLDAILNNDSSGLRRPLEVERETRESPAETQPLARQQVRGVDGNELSIRTPRPPPQRRLRGAIKSRFKGFGVDLDHEASPTNASVASIAPVVNAEASQEEGLFVSQDVASEPEEVIPASPQRQRKRRTPAPPEIDDTMADFAPTATKVKRRRIAAGEDPVPQKPTALAPAVTEAQTTNIKVPKVKKEIDILDLARQHREEAEARAKAEREELATVPEGLDLAEIRRLHIEVPMELRQALPMRTRERDIADGRWDPAWNGRKNFKKFHQRGAVQGRPLQKIIVGLESVKMKGFGIGEDYWLEDDSQRQKRRRQTQRQSSGWSMGTDGQEDTGRGAANGREMRRQTAHQPGSLSQGGGGNDEHSNRSDDDASIATPLSGTRVSALSERSTQPRPLRVRTATQNTSQNPWPSRVSKRAAPPTEEHTAKRPRVLSLPVSDDDSDDELRFRFGKR